MSRSYIAQDVYVNGILAFTSAQILDNQAQHRVRVRARSQGTRPNTRMDDVLVLDPASEAEISEGDTGKIRTWTGEVDGEIVTVSSIGRSEGCARCSKR